MKLVEFTKNMAPHTAGDTRLVEDNVAKDLLTQGLVTNVRPYPDPRPAIDRVQPAQSAGPDERRIAGKTYQTRKKG